MGNYREIAGNLITLALQGEFDVIAHGVNCFCTMGSGIAPQMAKTFGCDMYSLEDNHQINRGNFNKLGQIEFRDFLVSTMSGAHPVNYAGIVTHEFKYPLTVVNCYTQYGFGRNHENGTDIPLDYYALATCLRKINHYFKGKHIGLPQIGCGLGGGEWDIVSNLIQEIMTDCNVTVVIYDKS